MCLLWLRSELFPPFFLYTFTTLPTPYSVGFVVLGWILHEKFYVDIFHKPRPPGISCHLNPCQCSHSSLAAQIAACLCGHPNCNLLLARARPRMIQHLSSNMFEFCNVIHILIVHGAIPLSKMSLPFSQNSLIRPSVGPELSSLVSMELLQGLGDIIAEDTSNIRVQVTILTEYIILHSLSNLTVDVFYLSGWST